MPYNPQIHHRRSIRLQGYDYSHEGLYFITICCQDMAYRFGNVVNGEMLLNEYGQIAYNEWLKLAERFGNFELDVFQIMPNHMHGIISLHATVRATLAVAPNTNRNNNAGAGFTPAPNVIAAVKNMGGGAEMDMGSKVDMGVDRRADMGAEIRAIEGAEIRAIEGADRRAIEGADLRAIEGADIRAIEGADLRAIEGADLRATARVARTDMGEGDVSGIVGAYKSLVANGCLKIFKARNEIMGKLWQRNYYEHIIRDAQAYQRISDYIINNPAKWQEDKFYLK